MRQAEYLKNPPFRVGRLFSGSGKKRELAQLEQNIVKLSGAIQTDWPDEVSLASKKDQVLALERAVEKGEQGPTEDWLTELETIAQIQKLGAIRNHPTSGS